MSVIDDKRNDAIVKIIDDLKQLTPESWPHVIERALIEAERAASPSDAEALAIGINIQRQHLLWFVAQLFNERTSVEEGYMLPVRWQCLRKDLQKKYIEEAMQAVTAWRQDEEKARIARETHTPLSE